MEKVKEIEIFHSGVIIIQNRLEQCYYDYTSGTEALAYDRIAEVICDVEIESNVAGNFELYLDEAIRVGETLAASVDHQLMIVVNGIRYNQPRQEFQNSILNFGINIAKALVTTGEWQVRIETGGQCVIVSPDENED